MSKTFFAYLIVVLLSSVAFSVEETFTDAGSSSNMVTGSNSISTVVFQDQLTQDMFQNESKAKDLIEKRNVLINKIFQKRKDIIATDEKAKALHEQMLKIAKELSILIENKKVMRNLNQQLKSLDSEISDLPKKSK